VDIPDPLTSRYLGPEGLLEPARRKLSEEALYCDYCLRVELALLDVLQELGRLPDANAAHEAREAANKVTLEDIRAEEERVRHDLKALVNVWSRHCPANVRPFLHLGATSYDILSNAHLLRLKEGTQTIVRPLLSDVCKELARLARKYAATPQIGRTHGQYAEPLTFGYAMAVYLERLGQCIEALDHSLTLLRGKFSGAVGAFTTPGLLYDDPQDVEARIMSKLGLEASLTSTQIAHPEPALAVLHHLTAAFGVLANLADDLRHLQRSELNEVAEAYRSESQVGSSAMPHKRNPITWENVKSLWKTFMPQLFTFYMDQISEHQRDLSNSASARFQPRLLLGLAVAASRTRKGLQGLTVDEETMSQRLNALEEIYSGPAQAVLSSFGVEDAHERMRVLSIQAREQGQPLRQLIQQDMAPWAERLTQAQKDGLQSPAALVEPARRATLRAVEHWEKRI